MRKPPLDRYEFFHSTDLDYTREMVSRILRPHRLSLVGRERRLDARMSTCRLRDVSLNYVSYGGEVQIEPGPPGTFFVVQLLLEGVSEVHSGSSVFLSTPALASVASPSEHLSMHLSRDCARLVVRLERHAMESLLRDLLGEPLREPLVFKPCLDIAHGAGLRWRQAVDQLVNELDRPDSLVNHYPAVADNFERQLQLALLQSGQHNYSRALDTSPRPESARVVDLAIGLMEAHPEWSLNLDGVARQLGVNPRSLARGFLRHRDTSFGDYLTDVRFRHVHNTLYAGDPEVVSVEQVVGECGLALNARFAAEYRRRFGESPIETLRG